MWWMAAIAALPAVMKLVDSFQGDSSPEGSETAQATKDANAEQKSGEQDGGGPTELLANVDPKLLMDVFGSFGGGSTGS